MSNRIAIASVVLAMACTPGGSTPGASLSAPPAATSPAIASSPTASPLPGSTFTMTAEREMLDFFADRGALIARSTKEGPPPYESRILRAEPPTGPWRTVYQSDAMFMLHSVSSGRIAFAEYREPFQGGGAFSMTIVVLDLATGQKTQIDSYSLSAATFRGGGGAPRRPSTALAIGPDRIAWTRLVEGAGGSITGRLRIAPLSDLGASQEIVSSSEWVSPVGIAGARLIYVLGGTTEDQLRVRDLVSGTDSVLATARVLDTAVYGRPGIDNAVVSGEWAVWTENARAPGETTAAYAVNIVSGERRVFPAGGTGCFPPTAGARFVAWGCAKQGTDASHPYTVLDAKTLKGIAVALPSGSYGVVATDDALIWLTAAGDTRRVSLNRP